MITPAWIRHYNRADLRPDLIAGLTVGVMLIPQGMAYSMLAGLPPIYGLYASTVPLIIYAILGTSRHLSVGPVAIDSMLTAASISAIAIAGTKDYINMAILLALIVGVMQFSLGISRLGFLVKFLSYPVIQGFTSAAAIIICLSQLKNLLGIEMSSSQYLQDVILSVFYGIEKIHLPTFAIGITGIISLLLLKKYIPKIPGPLIIVVLAIIIVAFFSLDQYGVKIIGVIPSGLPTPELPFFDFSRIKQLLPSAAALALIGFMESLAVARSLQAKHKTYRVETNKELMTIGLVNMIGSIFKSFPVSGGFSRSAVNEQAGARTGMSSIVSALLVICTLLFLTPLFYYLPDVILASIVIVAVFRLIQVKEVQYMWKVDKRDFIMMMVTFLGTLFLGIGAGIGIGVCLSLIWIIFEASYPHHAELGRVPGTHSFRNIRRFKELVVEDDILIFRFDAPLFFANVERFRNILLEYATSRKTKLKAIVIDMESINSIDTSALHILEDTIEEIKNTDVMFLLAEVKGRVRDKFQRSGLTDKIGAENFFMSIEE
ncbi:MAG TPA: solute carrier family 26 protein, partial [Saprospiraceae bacterium]|nr:solute carrier family 26 protein [Saprospiraceae bacterium]